ncbi:hypothetical protein G7Y89_g7794 [Cudoniella acicularis]|uniref:FAD-binding PCMH-type domain-containing protein n=1 Tax=Cudoniella acicularis TaxID=354080 RepID=A0A8H4RHV3_9HELO|nr:hypothetical protein G7Y89_g7794 [Cudoniella acicularis]
MGSINTSPIEGLKASLSDSAVIVTRDSDKYKESIKRWSAASEKLASIVVFPSCKEDVAKIVKYATANNIKMVVAGGKHSTSGASSIDGGLCLDLSNMRKVVVDPEEKTVTAQGGCLWSDVDSEAAKYDLACVGGTVNHTGVGGLTLGGGYGYLSSKHGLVIDNLLEVEFVLANGNIVTASEAHNEDLFWCARGAGQNFGVATSFTYKAHNQKNSVFAGSLVFAKEHLIKVIEAANYLQEAGDGTSNVLVAFGAPPPAHESVVLVMLFYNGSEEDATAFFEPVLRIGPLVNQASVVPYPIVNTMLNDAMRHGFRRTMRGSGALAPFSTTLAEELFKDFQDFIKKVPDAIWTMIVLEYFTYKKIISIPQTATSFTNRGATVGVLILPGWTDKQYDMECREWTRGIYAKTRVKLMQSILESTDEVTKYGVGEYVNHDVLISPKAGTGARQKSIPDSNEQRHPPEYPGTETGVPPNARILKWRTTYLNYNGVGNPQNNNMNRPCAPSSNPNNSSEPLYSRDPPHQRTEYMPYVPPPPPLSPRFAPPPPNQFQDFGNWRPRSAHGGRRKSGYESSSDSSDDYYSDRRRPRRLSTITRRRSSSYHGPRSSANDDLAVVHRRRGSNDGMIDRARDKAHRYHLKDDKHNVFTTSTAGLTGGAVGALLGGWAAQKAQVAYGRDRKGDGGE